MKKSALISLTMVLLFALMICGCSASQQGTEMAEAPAANDGAAIETVATSLLSASVDTSFTDVPIGAWYKDAVQYLSEKSIMVGTGGDTFSPIDTFTRAQLATVLYRVAGEPTVNGEDSFTDTEPGTWYSDAILWAEQNSIVNGIGGGLYGTNNPVTQEQLVTMLWRMENEPDAAAASDATGYAANAVGWARENGIAPVTSDYAFAPRENATRAQVAVLVYNYLTSRSENEVMTTDTIQTAGSAIQASALEHLTESASAPVVYYISDISAEALVEIYEALNWNPSGKVAVKVSTGESERTNYLRADLIADLVQSIDGTIVECNTAYGGSRASSAMHRQLAADHGFTSFADFDLLDEDGETSWPVTGGARLDRAIVGSHAENYSDWLILSHFKGHGMAGFGGAIKNVGIGMSSASGKVYVHTAGTRTSGSIFYSDQDAWLEALPEMVSAVRDHVGAEHIVYISVMNRLSVDCDCNANPAQPDMHDVGILASTDPVALDQACVDFVYAVPDGGSLIRRMESRNGVHALEHGEEIGLGSREYRLVNIDA